MLLKRYWSILRPFHWRFYVYLAMIVVLEAAQVASNYFPSIMIQLFSSNADQQMWIAFFVLTLVFDELEMRMDNAADWHILARQLYPLYRFLKLAAIAKFFEMDMSWHQARNSGTLVGKVANGVEKVNEIMNGLSWEFIPTLIQTILSLLPLMFFSPYAALIAVATAVGFSLFVVRNHKERKALKAARYDLYEDEWHKSIEVVQSFETGLMFGQTDRLHAEQEDLHDRIIGLGTKEAYRGIYFYNRWQMRLLRVARRAIWLVWVYQLYNGTMDIPSLVFANTLLERLFNSFWRFSRLIDRASEAAEGAERLANLLEEKPRRPITGTATEPLETPVGIEMEQVQFSYTDEYTSVNGGLHDLNISIPGGSTVGIVGSSGAGKTTIRKVVTGLIPIHGGTIKVGGIDIRDWEHASLLKQFSYVPQGDDVFLFNGTVRDNIAFADPSASDEDIKTAAQIVEIHEFIEHLEEGYQTIVGERGKRLSGGQKQRIAIARALLADRPILILDEPTSAVDAVTESEMWRKLEALFKARGKTVVVIAHRYSTVRNSDKIVVLERGRKVEEGTHQELLALGGRYAHNAVLQSKE